MKYLFLVGPDGVGKTEISHTFANMYEGSSRYKCTLEKEFWHGRNFKDALYFDLMLPDFLEQTNHTQPVIFDRGFPCEFAYSRAYNRLTDYEMIWKIDEKWAKLGASIVFLTRHDLSTAREDELVQKDMLKVIDAEYRTFLDHTKCRKTTLYVDEFTLPDGSYSVKQQVLHIMNNLYLGR